MAALSSDKIASTPLTATSTPARGLASLYAPLTAAAARPRNTIQMDKVIAFLGVSSTDLPTALSLMRAASSDTPLNRLLNRMRPVPLTPAEFRVWLGEFGCLAEALLRARALDYQLPAESRTHSNYKMIMGDADERVNIHNTDLASYCGLLPLMEPVLDDGSNSSIRVGEGRFVSAYIKLAKGYLKGAASQFAAKADAVAEFYNGLTDTAPEGMSFVANPGYIRLDASSPSVSWFPRYIHRTTQFARYLSAWRLVHTGGPIEEAPAIKYCIRVSDRVHVVFVLHHELVDTKKNLLEAYATRFAERKMSMPHAEITKAKLYSALSQALLCVPSAPVTTATAARSFTYSGNWANMPITEVEPLDRRTVTSGASSAIFTEAEVNDVFEKVAAYIETSRPVVARAVGATIKR